MKSIKSKRAIYYIHACAHPNSMMPLHQAVEAVFLAEKDTEARAIEAANKLCDDLEPVFLHPMKREWMIDKFREYLNDGGQGDV